MLNWRRCSAAALPALLWLGACSRDRSAPTGVEIELSPDSAVLVTPPALRVLALSTYDGSGQTVHPDYAAPPRPWPTVKHYLAITPYPASNNKKENPTLYTGSDGVAWKNASGAPNPLVFPAVGYLSDPDIVYARARNELYVYYRQSSDLDLIYLIRSVDGRQWSKPAQVAAGPANTILSPAVVRRASGDWLMWTVNPDSGCRGPGASVELRRSADGITWSKAEPVAMGTPRGLSAWHIDVQWIHSRREFWALVPVKTAGGCATRQLYVATSPDGVTWRTLPSPLLTAGAIREFSDVVYRSTFSYDVASDDVTFWFSGARMEKSGAFTWSSAVQRRARAEVFDALQSLTARSLKPARRGVNAWFDPP